MHQELTRPESKGVRERLEMIDDLYQKGNDVAVVFSLDHLSIAKFMHAKGLVLSNPIFKLFCNLW